MENTTPLENVNTKVGNWSRSCDTRYSAGKCKPLAEDNIYGWRSEDEEWGKCRRQNSGLLDGPLCAPALGHNGHFHVSSTAWNSVSLVCAFLVLSTSFFSSSLQTQCLLPSLTASVYCHLLLPMSTAISYCSVCCQCLLLSLTDSVYCHLLLPVSTAICYCQCLLPVSTAISYCQCLLPFLTASVYCHLLLPVSSSFNFIFLQFSSDTKWFLWRRLK